MRTRCLNHSHRALFRLAGAAAFALSAMLVPTAAADESSVNLSILIQEGDPLPGGTGTVGVVNDIFVNNNGDWIADVNVSGGSTNRAIIRNGQLWLANGDAIPPNDTVSSVANLLKAMNNHGDVTFRPSLDINDSGVYLNFDPLLLEDDISTAPQFSPDTPYIGFFRSRLTDNGELLSVVTASDSELPGSVHRALVWLTVDPDTGDVTEDVLMKRHDHPWGTEPGVEFGQVNSNAQNFAISNEGNVIYSAPFTGSPSDTNGGIYVNETLVARKGDPSPVSGSDYANIGSSAVRVDMNDLGDYIFMCTLTNQPTATNTAIFRNNIFTDGPDERVIQRGDPVPGVPAETIDSFGTGVQPHITNDGDVIWYARFTGDSDTNQGLFINETLIMQKGVTSIDGNLVTVVAGTVNLSNGLTQGMVASDDGSHVIVRVRLADGSRAAVLAEICPFADLNCDGIVDTKDLFSLLAEWGECADPDDCPADLNGDGEVNTKDLFLLLGAWGS